MPEFDLPSANRIVKATKWVEKQVAAHISPQYDEHTFFQFETLEDVGTKAEIRVQVSTPDDSEVVVEVGTLVNKWGVLNNASAGYQGDCYYSAEKFYIVHGPCVVPCVRDNGTAITSPGDQTGTVGDPFTATATAPGVVDTDSFDASGLPPGITATRNTQTELELSGTPTTAGSYYVTITLSTPELDDVGSPTGGTCVLTEMILIEIAEAP